MNEAMNVKTVSYNSNSLRGVIIDALDRELGGYYDKKVMETYFPNFNPSTCESSLDLLTTLTEMGAEAVEEGKLPLFRLLSRNYDIVLKELPFDEGLSLTDIELLFEAIRREKGVPIEISAQTHECSAMGFVTPVFADKLCIESTNKAFRTYIAGILDDMNNESASCEYEYQGFKIWLSR